MSQYDNSNWAAQSAQTGYSGDQYEYAGEYSQTGQSSYYYAVNTSQQAGYSASDYQYSVSNDIDNSSIYNYAGSSPEDDIDDQATNQSKRQYKKDRLEDKNRHRTDKFVGELTKSYDTRYEHGTDAVAAKKRKMARLISEQTGDKTHKSSKDAGHKKSSKDAGRKGK